MTKTSVAEVVATWFGCGHFPVAPGTIGSLGAILPAIAIGSLTPIAGWQVALAGLALFPPAVWAADLTARRLGVEDPGVIVVDEVVGQCITMAGAAHLSWRSWAAGFVLFRAFDITKPFPIRRLEKLPGGIGIVSDDALAGVYAAVVLFFMGWLTSY